MVHKECALVKVEWLNFRLTFQAETLEEHEALKAVWVAFGSQVDGRAGVDDYISDSRELVDSSPTQSLNSVSN